MVKTDITPTILIVDDELSIRDSFSLILSDKYNLIQAASGEVAVEQVKNNSISLVFLDIRMPGMDGIETLKKIKEKSPNTEVIMVTAVNDVQKASEAVKLGAFNYIVKPFDVDKILSLTRETLMRKGILSAIGDLRADDIEPLINWIENLDNIASSKEWLLIIGEPGVEKELVARSIHQKSKILGEFLSLDLKCDDFSFVEKRLFTDESSIFYANTASNFGTVFIDNIDLLPPQIQIKLAGSQSRIICGSSMKAEKLILEKELLNKISATQINIPPLRERITQIPLFVELFMKEAKIKYGSCVKELSQEAKEMLSLYNWPGNVYELKAVIERLALISKTPIIEARDLPFNILMSQQVFHPLSLEESYASFEKEFLSSLLEANYSDRLSTAKMLNVNPHVLEAKL